jgi:hypothetical protein
MGLPEGRRSNALERDLCCVASEYQLPTAPVRACEPCQKKVTVQSAAVFQVSDALTGLITIWRHAVQRSGTALSASGFGIR